MRPGFRRLAAATASLLLLAAASCASDGEKRREPFVGVTTVDAPTFAKSCSRCSDDYRGVVSCAGDVDAGPSVCPAGSVCRPDGLGAACIDECKTASESGASEGCEFLAVHPTTVFPGVDPTTDSCFAAYLVNGSEYPVRFGLSFRDTEIDVARFAYLPKQGPSGIEYEPLPDASIPARSAIVVFLSQAPQPTGDSFIMCPKGAAVTEVLEPRDVSAPFKANAFRLYADAPVAAYNIYPFGGARSYIPAATLLLPVHSYATEYRPLSPSPKGTAGRNFPMAYVAAIEDGTVVSYIPSVTGVTGIAGKKYDIATIDKHQVVQFGFEAAMEFAGSQIVTNKPVGVWGGNACPLLYGVFACDNLHQQVPPVSAMGAEYVAVSHPSRLPYPEAKVYQFVGVANGTKLTYEPRRIGDAPTTLEAGQVVDVWSDEPFVVRSQDADHPFYVGALMLPASFVAGDDEVAEGDPEWVNVVPTSQFVSDVTFVVDPTFVNTSIVITRKHDASAKTAIDCLGVIDTWTTVGSYDIAEVTISRRNQAPGACANGGAHRVWGTTPFSATVWGWDANSSYAYPTAQNVKTLYRPGAVK